MRLQQWLQTFRHLFGVSGSGYCKKLPIVRLQKLLHLPYLSVFSHEERWDRLNKFKLHKPCKTDALSCNIGIIYQLLQTQQLFKLIFFGYDISALQQANHGLKSWTKLNLCIICWYFRYGAQWWERWLIERIVIREVWWFWWLIWPCVYRPSELICRKSLKSFGEVTKNVINRAWQVILVRAQIRIMIGMWTIKARLKGFSWEQRLHW